MGAAPRWGKGEVWAPYLGPPPLETRVWGGWERGPGCGNNPHGLQCAARRRTRSVSFGEQRELGLKCQQSYDKAKPKVWGVTLKLVIRAKACFVCLFSFQKLAATSTGYPLENPCASWGYGRPDPPDCALAAGPHPCRRHYGSQSTRILPYGTPVSTCSFTRSFRITHSSWFLHPHKHFHSDFLLNK